MSSRLPPLEPDVAEVLEAEKAIPQIAPEEKAQALARVLARLPTAGGGGGNGGGAGGTAGGTSTGGEPFGGPAGNVTSWARAHPWLSALAMFALGAGSGAALHASLARERVAYVVQPVAARSDDAVPRVAPSEPVASSAPSGTKRTPVAEPRVVEPSLVEQRGPTSRAPALPSGDTLAAERAIVDVARRALGSGDGAAALQAVAMHEQQFPSGLLEEEREAVAIKALALLGRTDDARSRAARFHARYPRSLLASAVERSVTSASADAGASGDGAF